MKINQEHSGQGHNINVELINSIQKHPAILAEIINELGREKLMPEVSDKESLSGFKISEKIQHNNIVKYREIFQEHKVFWGKLNSIYNELDSQGSNKKLILLRNVRNLYLKIKGEYLKSSPNYKSELEVVQDHADDIIDEIEKQLIQRIKESDNITAPFEIIENGLVVVLLDAFRRCKILEEPIAQ